VPAFDHKNKPQLKLSETVTSEIEMGTVSWELDPMKTKMELR